MSHAQALKALELLKVGNFLAGSQMEAAHEICQSYEGQSLFDWVHALVHRIEGDDWNADYWYQRAGKSRHPGTIEEEWESIRSTIEG